MYIVSSPILFLIFNRADTTMQVFAEIKGVKPSHLFIASDGPRIHKPGEAETVNNLRRYLLNQIDWDCEVKTLFRETNLGCGVGVSSAISWFFENVQQGIILEDDCVPKSDFFRFCDAMLEYYKNDPEIYGISGTNLQAGKFRGDGSYYFSAHVGIWGWASWARAWKNYDYSMKGLERFIEEDRILGILTKKSHQKQWLAALKNVVNINTWDYQWVYTVWSNNGKYITPNTNLIYNIGFSAGGTHVLNEPTWYKKLTAGNNSIFPIVHPSVNVLYRQADEFVFAETSRIGMFKKIFGYLKRIVR